MSCDCIYPSVYKARVVRTRKLHKCCECGNKILPGQQAEKVDALWDGQFSTIYTCLECMAVRDRLKEVFADDEDVLCCHGEMFEFLWHSDLYGTKTRLRKKPLLGCLITITL